jgi:hypothetical protein
MTWFFNLLVPDKPTGWFRAIEKSGGSAGLGFECSECHALFRYGILPGQSVKHCGRVDIAPRSVNELPTRSLVGGGQSLPANVIPCGWED